MKLSKCLQEKSITYLEHYITKKRKRPLPYWKEKKIKTLIKRKQKGLNKLTTQILNSPLYKLAEAEIIREGKVHKFTVDGQLKYEIPPAQTLLMMLKIVDVTNKQGQKNKLDEYCRNYYAN